MYWYKRHVSIYFNKTFNLLYPAGEVLSLDPEKGRHTGFEQELEVSDFFIRILSTPLYVSGKEKRKKVEGNLSKVSWSELAAGEQK